ncbi:unnamed protein product [Mytilus coruscus]|uniref:Uncharacterized protein n=1 Tax=Mytilus coruscus TaxID=42192 RepID=A0A6J8D2L9_MYTCO|nr:unnamed protein product [Mytilus coruscus]
MWQSQISSDKNEQHLPTNINKSIRLSHHRDEIIISIPNFYHVTPNLRIFTSAKDAILFRFVTNEYAVINPSNTIMDELTLFNEDSIPVHVLNLSTCTTLENTSTSSDTQFPASQDLFSSSDEGLDGSCDLFSDLSVAGNSECDKKRKFQISDDSDSHSVSLLSGKRPRNFRNK